MRRAAPPSAAILAVLLVACGGTAPKPTPTHPAGGSDAAPVAPGVGTFVTPGAQRWAETEPLSPTPLERHLRLALHRAVAPPPSLDCLAREYAAAFAATQVDPDPGAVDQMAAHCGYWTRPAVAQAVTGADVVALERYVGTLPPALRERPVAVGAARGADGRVTAAFLTGPAELTLAPVPRKGAGRVEGRLLRGDGIVELWIDDAEGPRELKLSRGPTGDFQGGVPASAGPARVELVRRHGRFRHTLALLEIGAPGPTGYTLRPAPEGPVQPGVVAAGLTEQINAARGAAELPALTLETRLASVLHDWMRRLPDQKTPQAPPGMLDDRGWPYARLRFAFTTGVDAAQAAELLLKTPTGRWVVTEPEAGQLAIGVRPYTRGGGFDAVIVSLVRFAGVPAAEARPRLVERLNALRAKAGHAPLTSDAGLDARAQALADAALAGQTKWPEVVPTLMQQVRDGKLVRGSFAAGALTAVALDSAPLAEEANALAPEMGVVGVGVAGGPLPGGGAPRYLIVYLVAQALPAPATN
jgi:hypothetical protein